VNLRPGFFVLCVALAGTACDEAPPVRFTPDEGDGGPTGDIASDAVDTDAEDATKPSDVSCAPGSSRCGDRCVDPQTDVSNCGTCGRDCRALPGVDRDAVRCRAGRCDLTLACLPGRADCTGDGQGCMSEVTSADRCGACTVRCGGMVPSCVFRSEGDAGAGSYVCSDGCPTTAPTRCGTQCVDVSTSTTNCGACGTVCPARGATRATCVMGMCRSECLAGYADCDGNAANGCEALLATSLTHCGRCNNACPMPAGRVAACTAGVCTANCATGRGDCDGDATNGCEADLRTSLTDCGACGTRCVAGPNATAACVGVCRITCATGFGDCDGMPATGCETDTRTSMTSCGFCGRACTSPANGSATCAASVCNITCNPGFILAGVSCTAVAPPQLVAPPSGSVVTTARPTLEWRLNSPATGAHIDVCRDRACASVALGLDVTGTSSTAGADLPPGVYYWRAFGLRDRARGLQESAVWTFTVGPSSTVVDSYWGPVLDVDGNGLGDLAVGGADATSVTLYAARAGGLAPAATVIAPAGSRSFGRALSAADVNGDGFSDLIVGTASGGRAFVYPGSAAGIAGVGAELAGVADFGAVIAGAGDFNRDGFSDVLFGTPSNDRVQVHYGARTGLTPSPSVVLTAPSMNTFGASVAAGVDFNGDGFPDVVGGAPGANRAYVFVSSRIGLSTVATPITPAGAPTTNYGAVVAAAGDVNGDGRGDAIIAAPAAGRVDVLAGVGASPPLLLLSTLTGDVAGGFGAAVAGAGDLDRDGFCDVVVASPTARELRVYRGSPAGLVNTPAVVLRGDAAGGYTAAVAGVGDTNGDGRFELAAGFTGGAAVRVFLGAASSVLAATPTTLTPGVGPVASFAGALR
jgi:hypothetical protein